MFRKLRFKHQTIRFNHQQKGDVPDDGSAVPSLDGQAGFGHLVPCRMVAGWPFFTMKAMEISQ